MTAVLCAAYKYLFFIKTVSTINISRAVNIQFAKNQPSKLLDIVLECTEVHPEADIGERGGHISLLLSKCLDAKEV